jgi:acetyl-CoA acyltransferase 2
MRRGGEAAAPLCRLNYPGAERQPCFPPMSLFWRVRGLPWARYTGAFKGTSAIELGACAGREAIHRAGVDPAEIDRVVFGNLVQTSSDALYGARHVGLKSGLKIETPAVTVNRLCGSGIEAIGQAAHRVSLGEAKLVLAGGMQNMTQAPM